MNLRFLLDTNIISEPLRPKPSARILKLLRKHQGEIALPAPVWHELRFGCARLPASRKRAAIEGYVLGVISPSLPILGYDRTAADWHAVESARLTAEGKTPAFVDGQIAAIARVNSLVLVTTNRRDFMDFRDLEIDDWRAVPLRSRKARRRRV